MKTEIPFTYLILCPFHLYFTTVPLLSYVGVGVLINLLLPLITGNARQSSNREMQCTECFHKCAFHGLKSNTNGRILLLKILGFKDDINIKHITMELCLNFSNI